MTELSGAHVFLHAGRKVEVRDWGGESYRRLLGAAKKTSNFGSSSLDACFVAAGRIEANIYGTLSTLDIASALGILTEAGGLITDAKGSIPALSSTPQRVYMANNATILESVRTLLEA
jgi:fructose-1,6-bisphosphatase/inositol monophosphatase family enzyme